MMDMRSDEVGGVIVLYVTGKLTWGGNTRAFREQVGKLLEAGFKKILVDMADVTHVDSSGISELVMAYATVSSTGGEMKLLNLGKRARDLQLVTMLSAVFDTFEDASSALLSYSSSKPSMTLSSDGDLQPQTRESGGKTR